MLEKRTGANIYVSRNHKSHFKKGGLQDDISTGKGVYNR